VLQGPVLEHALLVVGALLPLLGGGNVLLVVEPEDAMRYLALVGVGAWGLVASRGARSQAPGGDQPIMATACLLMLATWWLGELTLRASGPRAFLEAQGLFVGVLLFAGVSRYPLRQAELVALVHGVLVGALVTVAYSQYQYWVVFPRLMPILKAARAPAIDLVNANFYNANCYAAFLSAVILLGIGTFNQHSSRAGRTAIVLSVLALAITVLLSESRSTMGLLFLGAAALLALGGRRTKAVISHRRRVLAWTAVAAGAAFAVALAFVDLSELWNVGWLGRLSVWQGSLAMIRAHALLGVGVGRFWDYFSSYRVTTYYTRYPHNFLLEIFAELGIVGIAATLGFLVAAFIRPLRLLVSLIRCGGPSTSLPASVVIAAIFLFAHALVDIDWHAPANPILLFVLLGVCQNFRAPAAAKT
jgi:O-antigen ligase